MTACYLVRLGRQGAFVDECVASGFIGVDFDIDEDLTGRLPDDWHAFNRAFIPVFLRNHPEKTKVAAGLACGMLWTVAKGVNEGDLILSPTGAGMYHVGHVTGAYHFVPGSDLPHRRSVAWRSELVARADMSSQLQRSTSTVATLANITGHLAEVESLVGGPRTPDLVATDPSVEDVVEFALEKHLEDFLVSNWDKTTLGSTFSIYRDSDGAVIGRQYPTDTGPIDILAVSNDNAQLLVVELKRGRASDTVVGQIQRYMGYIKGEVAEPQQTVRGVIIALDDDVRLRRALSVAPDIEFYRYKVNFQLTKV